MIFGIGSDIVEIERIKNSIIKNGEKFLNRIFTSEELKLAPKLINENYYAYFAKRFAGKEAFSKALKTGIGSNISFQDIEILKEDSGAPTIKILKPNFHFNIHISLTDESDYALAFVIIENV
jgi:holo-[acyl-carrier protein] synthase